MSKYESMFVEGGYVIAFGGTPVQPAIVYETREKAKATIKLLEDQSLDLPNKLREFRQHRERGAEHKNKLKP